MSSFKRYLFYHLKSRIGYTLTASLLGFLITLFSLIDEHDGNVDELTESLFFWPAIILSIYAILSAILEFTPFLNRRNLDTLYAMPIKRSTMQLVHYLSGLFSTLFCHAASFFLVLFFWLPYHNFFSLGYAIPLYFISVVCGFIMYAISVFLFTIGNTAIDGCITLLFGGFSLPLILVTLRKFINYRKIFGFSPTEVSFFWSPINAFTYAYQIKIEKRYSYSLASFYQSKSTLFMIILFLVIGIATTVGFFLLHPKKRIETVGECTHSLFSYRTLVPLYALCCITMMSRVNIFTYSLIFVCMTVGYIIYRRTYRLKKSDLIVMGSIVLYSLITAFF